MALLVIKQLVIMALIALGGFIFAKSFGVGDKEQKFLSRKSVSSFLSSLKRSILQIFQEYESGVEE